MGEIQKMSGESKDILAENIQKIKELFPEVITEDKIDFEQLKEVLGEYVEDKEERYKFEWHGKSQSLRLSQTPSTGTLRPCKEESKNWDTTENLYIEGDNLEVLKLLQKTYHNRIKMIYIDPPYNTGKDFVYKDNYKDNMKNYLNITGQVDVEGNRLSSNTDDGGQFHTNWLNMMYPRLKLAKNLLSEDGIIFISVDDTEFVRLKKICDEIFGEGNSLLPFIWELPRGINAGHISKAHEYVVVYAKNKELLNQFLKEFPVESVERCNKKIDSRHPASKITFPAGFPYEGKDQIISGVIEGSEKIEILGEMILKDNELKEPVTLVAGWTMKRMIQDWINGKKVYDLRGQEIKGFFIKENGKVYSRKEIIYDSPKSILKGLGDSQSARKELEKLFGTEDLFDYPKPSLMIEKLIKLVTKDKDIIMDFFSGSGTTAQAIMNANQLDGSSRQYILVQFVEQTKKGSISNEMGYKNICEIGKERIRRAGDKIVSELKEKQNGQQSLTEKEPSINPDDLDIGFKVFKLDSSNLKRWNPDYEDLKNTLNDMVTNIVDGRTEEDLLYEIMLKFGIDLTFPIETEQINGKKVYNISSGALFICLDKSITKEVATFITSKKDEINPEITRVVFRDNGFATDAEKTNIVHMLKNAGIEEIMSV